MADTSNASSARRRALGRVTRALLLVSLVAATLISVPAPIAAAQATSIERSIVSTLDDAEESDSGWVLIGSSDLELVADSSRGNQLVGLRFTDLHIPQGATITSATIQFDVDETGDEATSLQFRAQASDNAAVFSSNNFDLSSRATTAESVTWDAPAWPSRPAAGPDQRTPDLATIFQEVVDRPGWQTGGAIAVIISGTGKRVATSFDKNPAAAPKLALEFSAGTSVAATTPTRSEAAGQRDGAFSITRFDSTAGDLSVDLTIGGTATPGADYVPLPSNVTIPDGVASITVPVQVLDDAEEEAPESITVTVGSSTASIMIADDDSPIVFENTITSAIQSSIDDVEQTSSGRISTTSSDIELVDLANGSPQLVGLRFPQLGLPAGATVTESWIQFTVDEVSVDPASIDIAVADADDAAPFATTSNALSLLPLTSTRLAWSPAPWSAVGAAGIDQRTPDLSAFLNELAERPGWSESSAVAFVLGGAGTRTAEAFDGTAAPVLHVTYQTDEPPPNQAPTVAASADSAFVGQPAPLTATVTDDGRPNAVSVSWTQTAGPATAAIADPTAASTSAALPLPGVYSFMVEVDDGAATAQDTVTITGIDPTVAEPSSVRFASIGDFGVGCCGQVTVADLVATWNPDFIVTVGDNNYDLATMDEAVGVTYADSIGNYQGSFGTGAAHNRFFPALGNHDYTSPGGLAEYLDYFTLPGGGIPSTNTSGNERYYDFVRGPVHFFVLNSNADEPDGRSVSSVQAQWLQSALAASTTPWQIAIYHHPTHSSGFSGGSMDWPFAAWGVDATMVGHDHTYERLDVEGVVHFVNGVGGAELQPFTTIHPGSQARYNNDFGAMLVEASPTCLDFSFHSISDGLVDQHTIGTCDGGPVDQAPTAVADAASTLEDTSTSIDVLANDSDVDGDLDPASLTVLSATTGDATVADGLIAFAPTPDWFGEATLRYRVCDLGGRCAEADVSVSVVPVNDAPTAAIQPLAPVPAAAGPQEVTGWASFIAGPDNESDQLPTYLVEAVSDPSLFITAPSIDTDGTLRFAPAGQAGVVTFEVRVMDNGGVDNGGVATSASVMATLELTSDVVEVTAAPTSERTLRGSIVSGSFRDLAALDGQAEQLIEESTKGRRTRRVSSFEHEWTIPVGGTTPTLSVTGRAQASSDGDTFELSYSIDSGATYVAFDPPLLLSTVDTTSTRSLPDGFTGDLVVRVVDSDRSVGSWSTDSIWIDQLVVTTMLGG